MDINLPPVRPASVFHIDTVIVIVDFHLLRKPPQWIDNPAPGHFHPSAASQYGPWHRAHLAAHFNVCGQVLLGAKGLGAGGAGVASLFGVHGGQVPVQVRAVPEVLQAVDTLHQLLLEVDGLLVSVRVGLEREAGRALGAEVAGRHRLGHGGAVEGLVVRERLGLRLVTGLGGTLHVPVHGQGHQRQGVAVFVFPEMLQAAEQPFAQGAGEPLGGPGAELWQESLP